MSDPFWGFHMMPLYSYRPIKYPGEACAASNYFTTLALLRRTTLGRDWRALALTQVHHGSRLSDSCEGGEALSSVHPPTPATGKLIHDLLCDGRVKND